MGQKTKGQTDQRILKLSFKKFKEEFGFRPDDKIEQRYFANTGERLTDPEARKRAERDDEIRQASEESRSEQ